MKHQEGYFKGPAYANIYYQCWLPEIPPKAVLLIAHGLAEHSGRYMNVVDHFVPLGYGVYGLDHIGHGKSDGARCYVDRFQDFVDTLKLCFNMIRQWHPQTPIFLLGHSMGGLISTAYLLEHQRKLAGAILSGPAVKVPDNTPSLMILAAKVLSAVLPKAGGMKLDAQGICSDPEVVKAYLDDPLVYSGRVTARLGSELMKAMQAVTAEMSEIVIPIMIIHGGDDSLVEPAAAQMLYDGISSEEKILKIYDGLYHEVFNESEKEQVLGDVENWLNALNG